jgi:amino acid adenylation domain-containing protein
VAKILDSCEPRLILGSAAAAKLLADLRTTQTSLASIPFGWMESEPLAGVPAAFTRADVERQPPEPLAYENTPADPAHILFTSGSTGTPKGVVVTHSNVAHYVDWATRYFAPTSSDRMSGHSPLHFDLSTYDIYGTLAAGASLYMVPPELNLLPSKLAAFIRERQLTQWFSVPSALTHMARFDVVAFGDFPALKRILWCGEVLPTPTLIYLMKRLPHVTFTNLYGPTEATIASSYYTFKDCPGDELAPLPIGIPCSGERLLVLDANLAPVPQGRVGELYILGVGLSPGYWRDPEQTRAAFLPNPRGTAPFDRLYRTGDLARLGEDGLLYFVGRADTQIKHRGYRIELGEVEAALNALDYLRECAVVAVNAAGFEGSAICCAYVPVSGPEITPVRLRRDLSKVLPGYMLPSRWSALAALPKNASGKIDRRKLKEKFEDDAGTAA